MASLSAARLARRCEARQSEAKHGWAGKAWLSIARHSPAELGKARLAWLVHFERDQGRAKLSRAWQGEAGSVWRGGAHQDCARPRSARLVGNCQPRLPFGGNHDQNISRA